MENIAVYLLSFFVTIKKVCSSSSGCNAQFHLFNKCGVGPGIHINQQIRSFLVGAKIWAAKYKIHIFANNVRVVIFPHCIVHIYEELYHIVILWWFVQNWTKLDLLQDIRKFYGELFDVHVFLTSKRNCQSVAFNPLATYSLYRSKLKCETHFSWRTHW